MRVGLATADDHGAAVRQLCKDWAFIDPRRVGTWGWSGGGSSTMYALCRFPDVYSAGVAVAGNYVRALPAPPHALPPPLPTSSLLLLLLILLPLLLRSLLLLAAPVAVHLHPRC